MSRAVIASVVLGLVCLSSGLPAHAQDARPRDGLAVLAPLATLGKESTSAANKRVHEHLEAGIRSVPGVTLVGATAMRDALRQAKRPALRACDGDKSCLAELGALLSARYVIYAEIGGLGAVRVIYLKLIDTGTRRELRSTTVELSGDSDTAARTRAGAFRLLDPDNYVGTLVATIDAAGAFLYVDGQKIARADTPGPQAPITLAAGTHALRVTHPEFRDFVRFVDIDFDREIRVDVQLHALPIIARDLRAHAPLLPVNPDRTPGPDHPWYRTWPAVAGFTAVVLVGSAIAVSMLTGGIDADREEVVGR